MQEQNQSAGPLFARVDRLGSNTTGRLLPTGIIRRAWTILVLLSGVVVLRAEEGRPPATKDPAVEEVTGGMMLENDSELEGLLLRAHQQIADGQFREAVGALQSLLDGPEHFLITVDGPTYHNGAQLAEAMLAKLPPAGLELYRLAADSEARQLLADPARSTDLPALETYARRFFLSSAGTEAALRLAALYLDRHDFPRAAHWLAKIIESSPDSSVNRAEVLARLVVARARAGDAAGARKAWDQLPAHLPLRAALRAEYERAAAPATAGPTWVSRDLKLWALQWDRPQPWPVELRVGEQTNSPPLPRESLVAMWVRSGIPSPVQLAHVGDRLLYVWDHCLQCVSATTGQPLWSADTPAWYYRTGSREGPSRFNVAKNFAGDKADMPGMFTRFRWPYRLLARDGLVARLENNVDTPPQFLADDRDGRPDFRHDNTLAVYEVATGKLRWSAGADTLPAHPLHQVVFLTAPVVCQGRWIAPIEQKGVLALVAFAPATGKLLWKTQLGRYPPHYGPHPPTPVGMATDGADVFVLSAGGVVLAADGATGQLNWATKFKPETDDDRRRDEWLAVNDEVVAAVSSRSKGLLGLNRRTGQVLYRTVVPRLGQVHGADRQHLFVATQDQVLALALATGRETWRTPWESGTGSGTLAGDKLLVPGGQRLAVLDTATGRVLETLSCATPAGDPLGNLVAAGNQIFVAGLERVYALRSGAAAVADLEKAVAAGELPALEQRAALYRDGGQFVRAAADAEAVWKRQTEPAAKERARLRYVETVCDGADADPAANAVAVAVKSVASAVQTPAEQARLTMARAQVERAAGRNGPAVMFLRELINGANPSLVSIGAADPGLRVRADHWALGRLREWVPVAAAEQRAADLEAARENSRRWRAKAPELGETPWLELIETGDAATVAEARAALAAYRGELGWDPPARALDASQPWQLTSRGTKAIKDVVGGYGGFWVPFPMIEPLSFLRRHLFYLTGRGLACLDLGADGAPVWVREGQFAAQEALGRRRALASLEGDWLQDSSRETPSFRPVGHLQPLWGPVKSDAADPGNRDTVNLSLLSLRTGNPVWEARVQKQPYLVAPGLGLSGRFDAAAGALAVVDGCGVRVLGLGTGETWWERTWPHAVATGVAVRGERVLVRLGNQSTVVMLDRRTGAEQGQLWFDESPARWRRTSRYAPGAEQGQLWSDESPPQELWCHWDDGAVLCLTQSMANDGFQRKRRFTLTRRALPGGETLWEQTLPEGSLNDPSRLFVAGAERFGSIGADGRLSLHDLASGKLLWTNPAPDGVQTCHVSYQPATERLWVARFATTVTRPGEGHATAQKAGELVALDLTTGKVVLRQPLPDMAAGTSGLIGPGAAQWYVTLRKANHARRTSALLRALPVGAAETTRAPWTEPVPVGSILACAREEYLAVESPGGLLIFQPVSGKESTPK